jgi:hypothetical protein
VFESFLYLISNGALDWGPPKHLRRSRLHTAPERTTSSTVRRVGLEGRGVVAPVGPAAEDSPEREPVGAH